MLFHEWNAHVDAFVFTGYDNSVPQDGSYHIANATSAADSNGTSTHTSGDIPTSSSSASLTRQMEMTKSAMHDGPVDSRHSDPNRTTIGTFGVGIDGSAAHLPSLAPIDPSATDPSSTQFNPGMNGVPFHPCLDPLIICSINSNAEEKTALQDAPGSQTVQGEADEANPGSNIQQFPHGM
ncbi:hypothetical protein F5887DRAFT_1088091 [Amanita rubescens]|nr:hypothetical protein F5887DRAFT_1088091 [Amanita rubescens]